MMKASIWSGACSLAFLLLVSLTAHAQDARGAASRLDKYERIASNSVEVTLEAPLLRLAAAALNEKETDERRAKELLSQVQGIYVRSYEFDRDGAYDVADVQALGATFRGAGWSRIADVKSGKYEKVEVYVSTDGETFRGISVIASDARSLLFVNISGSIRPERLADIEGRFSIPRLSLRIGAKE